MTLKHPRSELPLTLSIQKQESQIFDSVTLGLRAVTRIAILIFLYASVEFHYFMQKGNFHLDSQSQDSLYYSVLTDSTLRDVDLLRLRKACKVPIDGATGFNT